MATHKIAHLSVMLSANATAYNAVLKQAAGAAKSFGNTITSIGKSTITGTLTGIGKGMLGGVSLAFKGIGSVVLAALKGVVGIVAGAMKGIFSAVTSAITGAMRAIFSVGKTITSVLLGPFTSLKAALYGIGAAFGVTNLSIAYFLARQTSALNTVSELAAKLNITTIALTGLHYGAMVSGSSIAAVNKSLAIMSRRMGEAVRGVGEGLKGFWLLGLSPAVLQTVPLEDSLGIIADRIKQLPTQALQAHAAFAMFGRQGVELLNLLRVGADGIKRLIREAQQLGFSFSMVDAAKINSLVDTFYTVKEILGGVGKAFMVYISTPLENIMRRFIEWRKNAGDINKVFDKMAAGLYAALINKVVPMYEKLRSFPTIIQIGWLKAKLYVKDTVIGVAGWIQQLLMKVAVVFDVVVNKLKAIWALVRGFGAGVYNSVIKPVGEAGRFLFSNAAQRKARYGEDTYIGGVRKLVTAPVHRVLDPLFGKHTGGAPLIPFNVVDKNKRANTAKNALGLANGINTVNGYIEGLFGGGVRGVDYAGTPQEAVNKAAEQKAAQVGKAYIQDYLHRRFSLIKGKPSIKGMWPVGGTLPVVDPGLVWTVGQLGNAKEVGPVNTAPSIGMADWLREYSQRQLINKGQSDAAARANRLPKARGVFAEAGITIADRLRGRMSDAAMLDSVSPINRSVKSVMNKDLLPPTLGSAITNTLQHVHKGFTALASSITGGIINMIKTLFSALAEAIRGIGKHPLLGIDGEKMASGFDSAIAKLEGAKQAAIDKLNTPVDFGKVGTGIDEAMQQAADRSSNIFARMGRGLEEKIQGAVGEGGMFDAYERRLAELEGTRMAQLARVPGMQEKVANGWRKLWAPTGAEDVVKSQIELMRRAGMLQVDYGTSQKTIESLSIKANEYLANLFKAQAEYTKERWETLSKMETKQVKSGYMALNGVNSGFASLKKGISDRINWPELVLSGRERTLMNRNAEAGINYERTLSLLARIAEGIEDIRDSSDVEDDVDFGDVDYALAG